MLIFIYVVVQAIAPNKTKPALITSSTITEWTHNQRKGPHQSAALQLLQSEPTIIDKDPTKVLKKFDFQL